VVKDETVRRELDSLRVLRDNNAREILEMNRQLEETRVHKRDLEH